MRHVKRFCECCAVAVLSALTAAPGADRSYAGGKIAVEIGNETQFALGIEGGTAIAPIVAEKPGPDGVIHKHLGPVSYEDIVIELPPNAFTSVINDALDGKTAGLNGSIHFVDMNYSEKRHQRFQNAIVSGVKFPAMDAAAKDAARLELTLSPEATREESVQGTVIKSSASDVKSQKQLTLSNFRVKLAALPTTKVNKISAIEFRNKLVAAAAGEAREYQKQPAGRELQNVTLTLAATDAQPWVQWHDDFVVKGNNAQSSEKTMTVEYLAPNLQDVLIGLELSGVGIVAVRPQKAQPNADSIARVEVELYAESVKMMPPVGAKTAAAAPDPAAKEPAAVAAPADQPVPVATKKKKPVAEAPPADPAKLDTAAKPEVAPATAPVAKPVRRPR